MKNTYTKLRTKLERAYEEALDDEAFKVRARELILASMSGNFVSNRGAKADVVIKWAHTVDTILELLQDIQDI
jgi:hypothetical protein